MKVKIGIMTLMTITGILLSHQALADRVSGIKPEHAQVIRQMGMNVLENHRKRPILEDDRKVRDRMGDLRQALIDMRLAIMQTPPSPIRVIQDGQEPDEKEMTRAQPGLVEYQSVKAALKQLKKAHDNRSRKKLAKKKWKLKKIRKIFGDRLLPRLENKISRIGQTSGVDQLVLIGKVIDALEPKTIKAYRPQRETAPTFEIRPRKEE